MEQTNNTQTNESRTEEFRIDGDKFVQKIKELFAKGNVRRFVLQTHDAETVFSMPLTVFVILVIFIPQVVLIGLIISLLMKCNVVIELKK
jgi:hypothetical protein